MSLTSQGIKTWAQFWPYYVGEHTRKATRRMHFVGTTFAIGFTCTSVFLHSAVWMGPALVSGYGFAWFSHFAIEKNRPATFSYPLKSFLADFVMWFKMLTGTMDAEVERVRSQ
jgi:hypothetical protein